MQYNSQREHLLMPEYGRNIQKMIQCAIQIEDREERNKAAKTIISVMSQSIPNQKDVEDVKQKLWDHLFIISDFKLDVDSPYPIIETRKVNEIKRLPYPNKKIKYRHYGKNLEYFIEKAIAIEDKEVKEAVSETLANLMKKSYLSWNRDSVNDELIKEHLVELSGGVLEFKDNHRMRSTNEILHNNNKGKNLQSTQNNQNKKKTQHSNNNNRPFKKKY